MCKVIIDKYDCECKNFNSAEQCENYCYTEDYLKSYLIVLKNDPGIVKYINHNEPCEDHGETSEQSALSSQSSRPSSKSSNDSNKSKKSN